MNFVIPMAGKGQRFMDAGYKFPKMLIKAKNKTLLEWSVGSLPLELCTNLIFIGLTQHKDDYKLDEFIIEKYGNKTFKLNQIYIDEVTRGQSETVLLAENLIDPEKPLLIYNIDTSFYSKTLSQALQNSTIDGVLGSFHSNKPNYSFAKLNNNGFVEEVAEKKVISNNALTGLYHFSRPSDFFSVAKQAIDNDERVKNEFYIAPLYNKLINKEKKFILDKVNQFHILGTPEELKTFLND